MREDADRLIVYDLGCCCEASGHKILTLAPESDGPYEGMVAEVYENPNFSMSVEERARRLADGYNGKADKALDRNALRGLRIELKAAIEFVDSLLDGTRDYRPPAEPPE